jgi:Bifunctional DNA primase/polymerase, N-terminal/Primase C terminal 1 (PriCT-1)
MGTNVARALTESGIPVLRCCTGLKTPHKNSTGTWDICQDPGRVEEWLHPGDNLAILLGQQKDTPVLAVGLDAYKDASIIDFAKGLGVTKKAKVWAQRTGRGGYTVLYYDPGITLKRNTLEKGSAIDLLVNGYTLIAPSDTSREPQGGGPYCWLPGRSPLDIPLAELEEPPRDLLVWWQSLSTPKLPDLRERPGSGTAPDWLVGPIYEKHRNETLTKRAGYYHRMIPNDEVVRNLVHAANRADCIPPLSDREVDTILNSILRR